MLKFLLIIFSFSTFPQTGKIKINGDAGDMASTVYTIPIAVGATDSTLMSNGTNADFTKTVVFGPGGAGTTTDKAIALWSGTSGLAIKNSSITISGNIISGVADPTAAQDAVTLNYLNTKVNPAGTIILFAGNACPTNYILCNNAQVTRTGTYANLFTAIGTAWGTGNGSTTFNLPNLALYFVRGSNPRAVGSFEGNTLTSHTHTFSGTTSSNNAHTHTWNGYYTRNAGGSNQIRSRSTRGGDAITATTNSNGGHTHTLSGTSDATGGTETRPANTALLYCIKY